MAYFDLNPLLGKMLDVAPGISDLNLSVGKPPQVEIEGQLRGVPYAGIERLAPYHTELVAMRLLRGKRDLTEKLGFYLEFAATVSTASRSPWQGQVDGGLTYALTPDVQLDLGCNFGVTSAAPDFNPFVGLSFRY